MLKSVKQRLEEEGIYLRDWWAGNKTIACPRCSHTRRKKTAPCLSVTIDEEGSAVWYCHHCNWTGGAKNGCAQIVSKENVAALVNGATSNGVAVRGSATQRKSYDLPPAIETFSLGEDARGFFAGRGISERTLEHFRIRETRKWMPHKRESVPAIVFPYFMHGKLLNRKYRAVEEKAFSQDANTRRIPYNLDAIKEAKTCIIVEGEMDVLSAFECGISNVISLPDGAGKSGNEKRIESLNKLHLLDGRRAVVLAGDTDDPGVALRAAIAQAAEGAERWSVDWPEGVKDCNEALMRFGPKKVRECLENPVYIG